MPLKSMVKGLWLVEMIHSLHCSPPKTEPFMKRGEGKGHGSFLRTVHSASKTLLLGPSQKALKEKNPNWEWGHELMSLPVLLLHIIACKCAAVPAKRNSLFSETLLSLRWPESSNTHSPRGVQIRVCGCWLLFIWGGGEQVIGFEKFGAGWKKPTPPSLRATPSPFILEDFQQQTSP